MSIYTTPVTEFFIWIRVGTWWPQMYKMNCFHCNDCSKVLSGSGLSAGEFCSCCNCFSKQTLHDLDLVLVWGFLCYSLQLQQSTCISLFALLTFGLTRQQKGFSLFLEASYPSFLQISQKLEAYQFFFSVKYASNQSQYHFEEVCFIWVWSIQSAGSPTFWTLLLRDLYCHLRNSDGFSLCFCCRKLNEKYRSSPDSAVTNAR